MVALDDKASRRPICRSYRLRDNSWSPDNVGPSDRTQQAGGGGCGDDIGVLRRRFVSSETAGIPPGPTGESSSEPSLLQLSAIAGTVHPPVGLAVIVPRSDFLAPSVRYK